MNNLFLGSSGKIGKYYFSKSKLKFNFFSSSKKIKNIFIFLLIQKKLVHLLKNISTIYIFII